MLMTPRFVEGYRKLGGAFPMRLPHEKVGGSMIRLFWSIGALISASTS